MSTIPLRCLSLGSTQAIGPDNSCFPVTLSIDLGTSNSIMGAYVGEALVGGNAGVYRLKDGIPYCPTAVVVDKEPKLNATDGKPYHLETDPPTVYMRQNSKIKWGAVRDGFFGSADSTVL